MTTENQRVIDTISGLKGIIRYLEKRVSKLEDINKGLSLELEESNSTLQGVLDWFNTTLYRCSGCGQVAEDLTSMTNGEGATQCWECQRLESFEEV